MAHPLLAAGVSRWWKLHRSLPGGGGRLQGLPTHDADDDQHDGGNDESRDDGDSNGGNYTSHYQPSSARYVHPYSW